ncbi:MAG: hypothetical protein IJX67_02835 [Oscillospiraceae bacterium]|nr:hypothetical protein [Oscillospiraceae bacterium]
MKKKAVLAILCVVLIVSVSVLGTMAYLTDHSLRFHILSTYPMVNDFCAESGKERSAEAERSM